MPLLLPLHLYFHSNLWNHVYVWYTLDLHNLRMLSHKFQLFCSNSFRERFFPIYSYVKIYPLSSNTATPYLRGSRFEYTLINTTWECFHACFIFLAIWFSRRSCLKKFLNLFLSVNLATPYPWESNFQQTWTWTWIYTTVACFYKRFIFSG